MPTYNGGDKYVENEWYVDTSSLHLSFMKLRCEFHCLTQSHRNHKRMHRNNMRNEHNMILILQIGEGYLLWLERETAQRHMLHTVDWNVF